MNKITLNIGGRDRECRLGIGFILSFLEANNIELQEVDEKIKINVYEWLPKLMYHSLKYAVERNQSVLDFNFNDVCDWIDETGGVLSEKSVFFYTSYVKSLTQNVPVDKSEDKKKANQ